MTDFDLREFATHVILDHARDVEFLSISEMLDDRHGIDDEETARQVDELIRTAEITVRFPGAPPDAEQRVIEAAKAWFLAAYETDRTDLRRFEDVLAGAVAALDERSGGTE